MKASGSRAKSGTVALQAHHREANAGTPPIGSTAPVTIPARPRSSQSKSGSRQVAERFHHAYGHNGDRFHRDLRRPGRVLYWAAAPTRRDEVDAVAAV